MAETPAIRPVEVMARVRYKWLGFKEPYENLEAAIREDEEALCRAQIRALAEMQLSTGVIFASRGIYDGDDWDEGVRAVTSAVLLAAAEEGEK